MMRASYLLIFLACINAQFCEVFCWWWFTSTTTTERNVQLSTPEECARQCTDNEEPKCCYYHFTLEYYTAYNMACDFCEPLTNSSSITSSCECVPSDGFEKTILSINRMIPGPSIQVCKNDTVIIDVQNEIEGIEVSLHWHGIFQNGYQYYDGVPHLTQCPITSGTTFRYQYRLQNSGTHFYHAHISVHMIDGQYGSLIVRDPPSRNPHLGKYDEDCPEHVIVISDLFHELSMGRFPGRSRNNVGQMPDNFLINGRGNWTDPNTGNSTNISLATFNVESGKRYRFRVINSCATVCLAEIKIESHSMEIIATDGENVEPRAVNTIIMATGERVDFILTANQTSKRYWIHIRGLGECESLEIYQLAILIYNDSPESSLSSKPEYLFENDSPGIIFNPPNSTDCENNVCIDNLRKIYHPDEYEVPLNITANRTIILPFDFFFFDRSLFTPGNYERYFVAPGSVALTSRVGNFSDEEPAQPFILNGYQPMCATSETPSTCTAPCTCSNVYNVPLGAIVDLMIYDRSPLSELNHPFHLHGYSFCVLKSSQFDNLNNSDHVTGENVKREIEMHKYNVENNNYLYCAPKDTVIVPNSGFVILRFVADNPGWWFLHCHFLWHTATGMNVVVHVGEQKDLPSVPPAFPQCYNWIPPPNC